MKKATEDRIGRNKKPTINIGRERIERLRRVAISSRKKKELEATRKIEEEKTAKAEAQRTKRIKRSNMRNEKMQTEDVKTYLAKRLETIRGE